MMLGKELAELTAGLDALYRKEAHSGGFLDREGLIPVAVAEVAPLSLRDYDEARDAIAGLQSRIPVEAQSQLRHDYVFEMCDSLMALLATFEGAELSYADRVARQIRVDTQMVDESVLETYRATIRNKLEEIGMWTGDIAADVCRWETEILVPPEAVLQTLRDYVKAARERVSAAMFDMANEWIEPGELRDVPFSAYCDYPGRKLLMNLGHPYTPYALKHLTCHEAFPGHLVHLALRERYVAEGIMPLDGAQVVTSSASSALFEGIADNGLFFIDWVETPEDELAVALQRLRSALRCNAAWMLHAKQMPPDEVAQIIAEAGFQDIETTASQLGFLRHGLRAPFVYSYWCGDMAVHDIWKTVPDSRRGEFWRYLYGNMHTPKTLRDHWDA